MPILFYPILLSPFVPSFYELFRPHLCGEQDHVFYVDFDHACLPLSTYHCLLFHCSPYNIEFRGHFVSFCAALYVIYTL